MLLIQKQHRNDETHAFTGLLSRGGMGLAILIVATLTASATPARAAELVYFMSEACGVCDRWNEEIGQIYDRTEEAKVLPLRTQSVHADRPDDLKFIKGIAYTPTFVVVEDGREIGRIMSYIADYFFWEKVAGLVEETQGVDRATSCQGMDQQTSTC